MDNGLRMFGVWDTIRREFIESFMMREEAEAYAEKLAAHDPHCGKFHGICVGKFLNENNKETAAMRTRKPISIKARWWKLETK